MNDEKYNATGVAQPNSPMNQSPSSNSGLVPNTANLPARTSNLLTGQAIASVTFQSGISQKRIRITMDPQDTPIQSPATIAIIDENNNIVAELGASDGVLPELIIQRFSNLPVAKDLFVINDFSTNSTGAVFEINKKTVTNSHFSSMVGLNQLFPNTGHNVIWLSDGATPNGALTGNVGDFLIGGPGGHPFYCTGGTSWTQI